MSTATTTPETFARPDVRCTQILINNEWRDSVSGKTFGTFHPATEEKIADVAQANEQDVDLAVKAARKAFEEGAWAKMDARDRGKLFNRLADLIEENFDELCALETLDNGKPIRDA
ncbi:MAG: aldehyde dehydrogenase family protein, partial [Planctomycetaceae bacterium]|nr:aldehyde dehydrogenase family protein [Planctomycetaceae bacterium]